MRHMRTGKKGSVQKKETKKIKEEKDQRNKRSPKMRQQVHHQGEHKHDDQQEQLETEAYSDSDSENFPGNFDSEDHESLGQLEPEETEDYESLNNSEAGEGDVSKDEIDNHEDPDNTHSQRDQSENSEFLGVEESDSSEDEVAPRNTVGDVPLEWYRDEKHIGYDISGKKITKKEKQDKLDSFLASVDNSKNWRKIYDEYNDEEVELTKEETRIIRRLVKGKAPHADFDPYQPYVDWFKWDDAKHPLSNAPEPKRRFIPSKWESRKVVQYVRAIRKGLINFDTPKEEPRSYLLWGDDSSSAETAKHLAYIPAPKPKLPGHEESYNPSLEYIPMQEEINSYQLMSEEDRPKFIPKRFTSLRSITAYENALKDSFERCLDLYLCPRVRKKRINIDPESLKPKLPSRKDLRPYPMTCYLEYRGHKGAVLSISTHSSGQWIASASDVGDNVIVGSKEGKMCWFDMDLSSKPYKILKNHPKDITNLAFHRTYPLFASCSDDCTAYVFHGMVYADFNQNPLIVPLEILRGHGSSNGRGVLDCKFHPLQPWLFTAGADSIIKLYCH
ncbi:ribosome biogenesis protein BOP1 homolog [Carica papaya]|uniref:ribosome biogenesis protein BOP1 homolog n=1 Tax=Carica papaya TaxID=3649 RepID=UPI000B8CDAA0|nr:ribosome biogenesis protein BOP1 homolog [Carica papaya]